MKNANAKKKVLFFSYHDLYKVKKYSNYQMLYYVLSRFNANCLNQ